MHLFPLTLSVHIIEQYSHGAGSDEIYIPITNAYSGMELLKLWSSLIQDELYVRLLYGCYSLQLIKHVCSRTRSYVSSFPSTMTDFLPVISNAS